MKIIIAKYKEDLSWTKSLPDGVEVVVINKDEGGDLENNVGREANSYAWYIYNNYENLEGEYLFSQGRYSDQAPDLVDCMMIPTRRYFGHRYNCDDKGYPNYPDLCLDRYCKMFDIKPQKEYRFRCGAFFKVSAEELKTKSKEWYIRAFDITRVEKESSHCFERLWPEIFPRLKEDL